MAGDVDLDDDGTPDLVVGAPAYSPFGLPTGAVAIFYGPVSGDLEIGDADSFFEGASSSEESATDVAAAGDVNDDGIADLLVGAPQDSSGGISSGTVYLIHGPDQRHRRPFRRRRGDPGRHRLRVRLPGGRTGRRRRRWHRRRRRRGDRRRRRGASAGAVFLLLGPVSTGYTSSMDEATWLGEGASAYAGAALGPPATSTGTATQTSSSARTATTDSAAPRTSCSATWRRARSPVPMRSSSDTTARILAGASVAARGDIDGDGSVDLVVGAPGDDAGAVGRGRGVPRARSALGHERARRQPADDHRRAANELCGWSVAIPGDVDEDGIDDVLSARRAATRPERTRAASTSSSVRRPGERRRERVLAGRGLGLVREAQRAHRAENLGAPIGDREPPAALAPAHARV